MQILALHVLSVLDQPPLVDADRVNVLDVGVGSGALVVALAKAKANVFGFGIDVDRHAVVLAQANAQR